MAAAGAPPLEAAPSLPILSAKGRRPPDEVQQVALCLPIRCMHVVDAVGCYGCGLRSTAQRGGRRCGPLGSAQPAIQQHCGGGANLELCHIEL